MHELALTQSIVEACGEAAAGRRVRRVSLEIGRLSCVVPEALRFCFDVAAQGTEVEGAELQIEEVAGRGRCRECGNELVLEQPFGRCGRCRSMNVECVAGEELNIKEIEVV